VIVLGNRLTSGPLNGNNTGENTSMGLKNDSTRHRRASGFALALTIALACLGLSSPGAQAEMEITAFEAGGLNAGPTPSTGAGERPFEQITKFTLSTITSPEGSEGPSGNIKDVAVHLPPGVVGNAAGFPRCPQSVMNVLPARCPSDSQVGTARVRLNFITQGEQWVPVYNLVPPKGTPAQFGFLVVASISHINFHVRSDGDYGVTATLHNLNETAPVYESTVRIWGVPADPAHDAERCSGCNIGETNTSYEGPSRPFISNPTSCTGSLSSKLELASWQDPDTWVVPPLSVFPGMTNCDEVEFAPSIDAKPTTNLGDSPSGLDFNLHVPQNQDPNGKAAAHLRDSKITLPPTLVVNPSSANGLGVCAPDQIGLNTPVGQSDAHFNEDPAHCPDNSKLGTVRIDSPAVIDHPLNGNVYLAAPHQNPFGSLLAMYISVEDPQTGVGIKLAGEIQPDPATGQLSATVSDAPQLPFEDLHLEFFKGAGAPLRTPLACGTYQVNSDMVPWTSPEGATMHPTDTFAIEHGAGGGACAGSEATAPIIPGFEAGTADVAAGAYSPFTLKLSRADGTQQLSGIDTTLPKGLIAKLAGVPYCSDAALAAAASKEGRAEQQSPSCPAASQVGSVTAGAGAGPTPYYTSGKAYLAGPYKGAPLSLAIVTPAVAGPFDLGTVVVRTALFVDPETAQVRAISDPLPTILQGIPLDLRSVVVRLDRPNFTKNPTSCNPFAITGSAFAVSGQSAPLFTSFQVGDCGKLAFAPKLKLSLTGGTKRSDHPALKAVLTTKPGEANIGRAAVILPPSEFLENAHIKTICTRVQFAADTCPAGSVYGKARAVTPLLDNPISGPVYLRSSNHQLPDLVADLNGQIEVVLAGRIDSVKRRIRSSFEVVPDAPVSKFVLEMQGGKKGLLVNNRNLCKSTNRATIQFDGQNGKTADSRSVVTAKGCKKSQKGGKGHKRKSGR
jgi:hypothetical protein